MRITAALVEGKLVRIQCFVDDPLVAVAGTPQERRRYLVYIIILWLVLGYKLNWGKGHRGQVVPWISATIAALKAPIGVAGITLSIGK